MSGADVRAANVDGAEAAETTGADAEAEDEDETEADAEAETAEEEAAITEELEGR